MTSEKTSDELEENSTKTKKEDARESPESCSSRTAETETETADNNEWRHATESSAHHSENSDGGGGEENKAVTFAMADLNTASRSGNPPGRRNRRPVIFTYPSRNRPRQPFMNQPTNETNSRSVPPPPPYYSSRVAAHSPQFNSNSRETQQTPSPSPQPRFVQYQNMPSFRTGQLNFLPNELINPVAWAPYPQRIPANTPACLAHLIAADSLFIVQQLDIIEMFIEVTIPNTYLIQNKFGESIYYVYETTTFCSTICCSQARGFQLHIMDMYHNEIIYMNRPCGCYNYFCCYPVMEVYSPPLVPVGAITKTFHPTHDELLILDADENKMFKIHGPCFVRTCGCCLDAEFTIHALDADETEIGIIRREWGGLIRYFFDTDYYGITFPVDLDVRIKAVFLGALFLIEYSFFERN